MVGEVGVMCDLQCAGGFIGWGAAPGVENKHNYMNLLIYID